MELLKNLAELQIDVTRPVAPLASYLPAKISGKMVYVSGQLPFKEGVLMSEGLVDENCIDLAKMAAAQCFINCLCAAASVVDLQELLGVIQLQGFVASRVDFFQQAQVINGASDLASRLFGEEGKHSRMAVGVSSLPLNASVEVAAIFELK